MVTSIRIHSTARTWPHWPLPVLFSILFLGPPAAALFVASGVPLMRDLGWFAHDILVTYICPTPAKTYLLYAAPMAVCARCWGATIGLWLAYSTFFRQGLPRTLTKLLTLPWMFRMILTLLPFGLWVAEILFWPTAAYWVLILNGAQAGMAAGLFMCSIWPQKE